MWPTKGMIKNSLWYFHCHRSISLTMVWTGKKYANVSHIDFGCLLWGADTKSYEQEMCRSGITATIMQQRYIKVYCVNVVTPNLSKSAVINTHKFFLCLKQIFFFIVHFLSIRIFPYSITVTKPQHFENPNQYLVF